MAAPRRAHAQTEAPSYHAEDWAAELARSSADEALLLCLTVLPACGDVAAVLKSSRGTGTNFEIAATDLPGFFGHRQRPPASVRSRGRTMRSRPRGVSWAFLCMFIRFSLGI
jgi:hypothetical protein